MLVYLLYVELWDSECIEVRKGHHDLVYSKVFVQLQVRVGKQIQVVREC